MAISCDNPRIIDNVVIPTSRNASPCKRCGVPVEKHNGRVFDYCSATCRMANNLARYKQQRRERRRQGAAQ